MTDCEYIKILDHGKNDSNNVNIEEEIEVNIIEVSHRK